MNDFMLSPIGYQIPKKSETFGLKQCSTYPPPGGGGGVPGLLVFGRKKVQIIGIWESKNQYLARPKAGNFLRFGRPNTTKNTVFER